MVTGVADRHLQLRHLVVRQLQQIARASPARPSPRSVEGWMVSPRKSRRKSACFSSTTTSTPARASRSRASCRPGRRRRCSRWSSACARAVSRAHWFSPHAFIRPLKRSWIASRAPRSCLPGRRYRSAPWSPRRSWSRCLRGWRSARDAGSATAPCRRGRRCRCTVLALGAVAPLQASISAWRSSAG